MSNMFFCEEMNLYMGDDDPSNSKHLTLKSVKLPVLQEKMVDHQPAGSMFAMKLGMGYEALELGWKMAGTDPAALSQFGLGQSQRKKYTGYGAFVDKQLDVDVELKVVVQGRLCKIEHDEFQRGDLQGCDYMVSEVVHYEVWWDLVEKYYYDMFTQAWRVDGVDQRAKRRAILRIPN